MQLNCERYCAVVKMLLVLVIRGKPRRLKLLIRMTLVIHLRHHLLLLLVWGASGAGPSGASSSYTVPEVPRDIMYYDGIRQMPYRIPGVPVEADLFGSLVGVPPDTVSFYIYKKIFVKGYLFNVNDNLCHGLCVGG